MYIEKCTEFEPATQEHKLMTFLGTLREERRFSSTLTAAVLDVDVAWHTGVGEHPRRINLACDNCNLWEPPIIDDKRNAEADDRTCSD